jgi:hypothetical protein
LLPFGARLYVSDVAVNAPKRNVTMANHYAMSHAILVPLEYKAGPFLARRVCVRRSVLFPLAPVSRREYRGILR